MSDPQPKPDKTLSEISHLFLSSVRERQMQGAARPTRRPPQQASQHADDHARACEADIDLTPEEFAQVLGGPEPRAAAEPTHAPVSAMLAAHLGARQLERAREYAASQAAGGARVGLIEIDASEFRVWSFEPSSHLRPLPAGEPSAPVDELDGRRMSEALHEMAHDVDQWLVLVHSPRATEARGLLRDIDHWILLASPDHDGIVAGYRTLKGLSESHQRNEGNAALPRLSLAVMDARDQAEASRVFGKLASVCQQFLHWPLEAEPPVTRVSGVCEHLVLACRSTRDKAQLAAAPQWQVVQNFIKHLATIAREPAPAVELPAQPAEKDLRAVAQEYVAHSPKQTVPPAPQPAPTLDPAPQGAIPTLRSTPSLDDAAHVIDLPTGDSTPQAIASAVLRDACGELVECPVRPPTCPSATLAVARDRRLVLVAVAREGLSDLRAIGQAYRWMIENRPLIAMAVPQLAIDAHQLPRLHLLVDHADASAELLQPMLQSGNVAVHAYRKLRWGEKTGLLLEAA